MSWRRKILKTMKSNLVRIASLAAMLLTALALIFVLRQAKSSNFKLQTTEELARNEWLKEKYKVKSDIVESPWDKVPDFEVYMRMRSRVVDVVEYNSCFLRGYKQNFPPEKWNNSLVIGLDRSYSIDYEIGLNLSSSWPHPRIYYHDVEGLQGVISKFPDFKEILGVFHPEKYIKAKYIAYVNPDTCFSTTVTPGSLFENGKPIIVGLVSNSDMLPVPSATRYLLSLQDMVQCTSYFPVIIKREHIIELREMLIKSTYRSIEATLTAVFHLGLQSSVRYSLLCNYVWYFHRDEYVFYPELPHVDFDQSTEETHSSNTDWILNSKTAYSGHHVKLLPKPRISISACYIKKNSLQANSLSASIMLSSQKFSGVLRKSFCYIAGFEYKAECCSKYHESELFHELYKYIYFSWEWHKKALEQQQKYLEEAKQIVEYHRKKGLPLFGIQTEKYICPPLT